MDACEVYAADPEATTPFTGTDTFTITSASGVPATAITGSGAAAATEALTSTGLQVSDFECQSRTAWPSMTINGELQTDGSIRWTASPQEFADALHVTFAP